MYLLMQALNLVSAMDRPHKQRTSAKGHIWENEPSILRPAKVNNQWLLDVKLMEEKGLNSDATASAGLSISLQIPGTKMMI